MKTYSTIKVVSMIEQRAKKKIGYGRVAQFANSKKLMKIHGCYIFTEKDVDEIIFRLGKKDRQARTKRANGIYSTKDILNVTTYSRASILKYAKKYNVKKIGGEFRYTQKDFDIIKALDSVKERK